MYDAIKHTQMMTDAKVMKPMNVAIYSLQTVKFGIQLVYKVFQTCLLKEPKLQVKSYK